jgi:hypothetical protein
MVQVDSIVPGSMPSAEDPVILVVNKADGDEEVQTILFSIRFFLLLLSKKNVFLIKVKTIFNRLKLPAKT